MTMPIASIITHDRVRTLAEFAPPLAPVVTELGPRRPVHAARAALARRLNTLGGLVVPKTRTAVAAPQQDSLRWTQPRDPADAARISPFNGLMEGRDHG
jgi:hypothetical protein